MVLVALIVHTIAAVLGGWGATLLCRLVVVRIDRKRRRPGVAPVLPLTPRQQTAGLLIASIVLLLSILIAVIGEGMRTGFNASYGVADKLIMSAAAMLLILAVGAASAGWFYDPPRGRRRCPSCWYDMATIVGRCPECGRETPSESSLSRTRRSRRLLALAPVLLVVGASLYSVRLVRSGSATSVLPTALLLAALPILPPSALEGEGDSLAQRIRDNRLSPAQLARVQAHCLVVIARSRDTETAGDLVAFFEDTLGGAAVAPTLSDEVVIEYLTMHLTPAAEGNESFNMYRLAQYIPRRLSPEVSAKLLPRVQEALLASDTERNRAAMGVTMLMGPHARQLKPLLIDCAVRNSSELDVAAATALLVLAVDDDRAWEEVVRVTATDPDIYSMHMFRWLAGEGMWRFDPSELDRMRLEERLVSEIETGTSPEWACAMLVETSPDALTHLPAIARAVEKWPSIAKSTTLRLAARFPAQPETHACIRGLLRSTDPLRQQDGIIAALQAHPHAAPLLPELRAISADTSSPAAAFAAHAIDSIELRLRAVGPPK